VTTPAPRAARGKPIKSPSRAHQDARPPASRQGSAQDDLAHIAAEWCACAADPAYFIHHYVLLDTKDGAGEGGAWAPFRLWPAQLRALDAVHAEKLLAILKARQLGMTWLLLGYALWLITFRPGSAVGLFSRRQEEAVDLLDARLKEMHRRLPAWCRVPTRKGKDNKTTWELANGSTVRAFPTSAGDSYTFSLAIVDEADLCDDLDGMLNAVKPTIDAGGRLVLLSKVKKDKPGSAFKRIARSARDGSSSWRLLFLGWRARPGRDAAWYEAQRQHSLAQNGTLDFLHENYPDTPEEALAALAGTKRLPGLWLAPLFDPQPPILVQGAPALDNLRIYEAPIPGAEYRIGADPAEGLVTGDDSACTVVERKTGRTVASWDGKWEPQRVFPRGIAALAAWYNAPVLVERNNHGHAVMAGLKALGVLVLEGLDGRDGYNKTGPSQPMLWDAVASEVLVAYTAHAQEPARLPALRIRDAKTFDQLGSIEADTLKAPTGQHDDAADGWSLAQYARGLSPRGGVVKVW